MSRSLKIAFDAKRLFHNREGLGSYARTLVNDLKTFFPAHKYYLCTPSVSKDYCDPSFYDPNSYTILTPPKGANPSWWRSRGVVKTLLEHEIDVYFGLSNELPFGIHKHAIRTVVTVHDMLYKTFPQQFSLADRWIYAKKFSHVANCAEVILATSQHTRSDIIKYHGVDPSKIRVAYQSLPGSFRTAEPQKSNGEYYLMVGTLNARKNHIALIEAYNLLEEAQRRPVIVVGRGLKYKKVLWEKIQAYGLVDYFTFMENVSENELVGLYKGAIALVFPSKYEGFGIPIIEALHLEVPVIALQNSSIPEVVSKYGIIIEYDRPELLNEAILLMNKEEARSKLLDGVEEHLLKFNPQKAAQIVMAAIEDSK